MSKFKDPNEEYILLIEDLFKKDESVIQIQKKEHHFPLDTQDVIFLTKKNIVQHINNIAVYVRNNKFTIVCGKCNLKDRNNTKLINEKFAIETQLEDMNVDWKKCTLLSFGSSPKLIMNRLVS